MCNQHWSYHTKTEIFSSYNFQTSNNRYLFNFRLPMVAIIDMGWAVSLHPKAAIYRSIQTSHTNCWLLRERVCFKPVCRSCLVVLLAFRSTRTYLCRTIIIIIIIETKTSSSLISLSATQRPELRAVLRLRRKKGETIEILRPKLLSHLIILNFETNKAIKR